MDGQIIKRKRFLQKRFADFYFLVTLNTFRNLSVISNYNLTEKQAVVMQIEKYNINSDAIEQLLYYFYHGKVKDII